MTNLNFFKGMRVKAVQAGLAYCRPRYVYWSDLTCIRYGRASDGASAPSLTGSIMFFSNYVFLKAPNVVSMFNIPLALVNRWSGHSPLPVESFGANRI